MKSLRTPEHLHLIELLVAAREKARLTQQQLADRLGKPQSFIAKYEGGERRIDVIEFLAITRALQVDPRAHRARDRARSGTDRFARSPGHAYNGLMKTRNFAAMLALVAIAGCASIPEGPVTSPADTPQDAGMVDVSTLVPDLRVDMRYVTATTSWVRS